MAKWTIERLEKIMCKRLAPWQREVVEAEEERLILCCGRKSGKTEVLAWKIVLDILNNDFSHSHGICIISKGQRMARELFLVVKTMLSMCGIQFQKDINKTDEPYGSMTMLRLPVYGKGIHGNRVYSLPSGFDGVALRTYSFWKLYRDEDAFIPDPVDPAVTACLAVHGVQEIRASTPCGNSGSFYRAWTSGAYRRWHRKSALSHWVSKAYLRHEKQRLTKSEYDQEYNAMFTELAEGIYRKQLVSSCMRGIPEDIKNRSVLFIGVDFARFGDDENVIALNFYDGKTSHIMIKTKRTKIRTTEVARAIISLTKKYKNFRVVVTDSGGLGEGPTDMLYEALGRKKVIGVKNQERWFLKDSEQKKAYASVHLHRNLIGLMENGKVILDDDAGISRSLLSMKYKLTQYGEQTMYGRDSHAAEAIVRAVHPIMFKKFKRMGRPNPNKVVSVPHSEVYKVNDDNRLVWNSNIKWS